MDVQFSCSTCSKGHVEYTDNLDLQSSIIKKLFNHCIYTPNHKAQ